MERIIKDEVDKSLLVDDIIRPHQHAFVIEHSTSNNLLEATYDWSILLNRNHQVDALYHQVDVLYHRVDVLYHQVDALYHR